MALDESLTLENLGLALHDTRTQESRRLLEGFFSLKRQVLVELLSDCCANASAVAMGPLESTCYALQDAARWYHPKERCAQLEFELLRLCAQVASRPGHLLLIQSLQRAFRGISDRLLPFMGGDAMRQWVICALDALYARDVQALQHQLPALMKTYDELVLDQLAPVPREQAAPEAPHAQECSHGAPASGSAQDDAPEAHSCVNAQGLRASASATAQDDASEAHSCVNAQGLRAPASATAQDDALEAHSCVEEHDLRAPASGSAQDDAPEAHSCVEEHDLRASASATARDDAFEAQSYLETLDLGGPPPATGQDDAYEVQPFVRERGLGVPASITAQDEASDARSCDEQRGLGRLAPAAEDFGALGVAPRADGHTFPSETDSRELLVPSAPGAAPCEPYGKCTGGDVTSTTPGNLSDCRAGWDASSLEGGIPPEAPSSDFCGHTHEAGHDGDGPLHVTQGRLDC
ncbi:GntR family transcriptional regulator [Corallococcus aberystwythensis]|uniref:GntR family transcriptional regulator n=1 Tax=Corallococcus aberystwythensis TaxID=2316722 RepID=A0A3A8Q2E7_9BACT|nr:GntR family transcriptional regulator [Corallococcus aberystwythensis]